MMAGMGTKAVSVVTSDGAAIPALGFGTYGMSGQLLVDLVREAANSGFRHVDTAQVYGNEAAVGEGIRQSRVGRDAVFVTTKVWVSNYGSRTFAASVDESLGRLGMDHVDLLLLHWPSPTVPLADQIGGLNAAVNAGKARYIGVSNFPIAMMEEAVRLSQHKLLTNQFEYHPYLGQRRLVAATRQQGLAVTAYCGMAVGRVLQETLLQDMALRYHRSVAQIVLRWLVQQEKVIALSRTTNVARLAGNVAIFDFRLDDADMEMISALATPGSRIVDPPGIAPQWDPTD